MNQMPSRIKSLVFLGILFVQLALVNFLRFLLLLAPSRPKLVWAVGPAEVAGVARSIGRVLPSSQLFIMADHAFYSTKEMNQLQALASKLIPIELYRFFVGPFYLARISTHFSGAVYIGSRGYLVSSTDQREREFRFLKKHGRKIICVLTGSDIRSVKSMLLDSEQSGSENIANYIALVAPSLATEDHEMVIRHRCAAINTYADLVFTSPFDQKSFLRKDSRVFTPFLESKFFSEGEEKFQQLEDIVIFHSPSSPVIKGTQLVRSAISRLRNEGHQFRYIELLGVKNTVVMEALRVAHIAVNEFYAYVPGVFGVEALANKCVLVTRASHAHDPSIPGTPERAWVPTEPYKVYETLLRLLTERESLLGIAREGYNWATEHAHEESAGREFAAVVASTLDR